MRKQTKVAAVVSAAVLLAIGASMTSFAKGWEVQDGEWVFLDSDDERVYGEWKKSVDGNYYWLDEETGVMATDRIVEDEGDTYYVGATGVRVTNDWVAVENEDGENVNGVEVDTLYYYMGSNGKAYKNTGSKEFVKKSIGGATYFFDTNGFMQNGWLRYDGNIYYCGTEDQGWTFKGWQYLETDDVAYLSQGVYEDSEWFYFDGGKLVKGTTNNYKTKYIDKHYYKFNDEGVMVTGWKDVTLASTANGVATSPEAFSASNGVMSTGWVKADKNDETKWFYMVTVRDAANNAYRAVPFNSGASVMRAKSIDGKVFLFDTEGRMQTGLKDLRDATEIAGANNDGYDGVTYKYLAPGIYYFSKESGSNEGRMVTGKQTNTVDGEEFNYYFDKNGKALTSTIKDNVIYDPNGVRVEAKDGNTYERVTLSYAVNDTAGNEVIPVNSTVCVSATGKVRTSGSVRIDGEKYDIVFDKTNKIYTVTLNNN